MSRKNFGAKPLSYPQPVWIIATYDKDGKPNTINAAWGGISEENEVSICLSPSRKTFMGRTARIIRHGIDHCNGILI